MRKPIQHGFSLLELSVSIAISAIIGLLVWNFLAVSSSLSGGNAAEQSLLQAQDALEGFAQANFRLPCPATSAGGAEDCSSGATSGWLPERTLGLSGINPLHYGVAAGLMTASNRYTPNLPPVPASSDATRNSSGYTSPVTNTANGYTSPVNGLDLCYAILKQTTGISAGGVTSAYVLADAGANHTFDGSDANGFALPGTPLTPTFDDHLLASGRTELFTRLGCPSRLDAADAAARAAYAAYDLARLSIIYHTYRLFQIPVQEYNYDMAVLTYYMALTTVAIDAATTVIDAAAIAEGGIEGPAVVGLLADFASDWSDGSSLTDAISGKSDAADAVETAKTQETEAATYQAWALQQAATLLEQAEALDQKGLLK